MRVAEALEALPALEQAHAAGELSYSAIREITARRDVLFIVNDRPDIALLAHADGVHVGQTDLPVGAIRSFLGDQHVVGVSTHSLEEARSAEAAGADYIGAGPVFRAALDKSPEEDLGAAVAHFLGVFSNTGLTWDDLEWLQGTTTLPIVLKGILHPDDAREAADRGVGGIVVSNHGGRQANGGLAAIDMLPAVVEASGSTPVLFDSGIRSGTDVIKALALGARAVGVGRPFAYGLALGGTDSIVHVLRCLLAEADLLMAVDGYPTLADLAPSALTKA